MSRGRRSGSRSLGTGVEGHDTNDEGHDTNDDPDRDPDVRRPGARVTVSNYADTGPTIRYMELKGFDDKRSPIVSIVGAIVTLIVALWILKRIIGTLFLLAKIAIVIVMVLAIVGVFIRWSNKRTNNKKK